MDLGGGGRRGDVKEEKRKKKINQWMASRMCSIKKDLKVWRSDRRIYLGRRCLRKMGW